MDEDPKLNELLKTASWLIRDCFGSHIIAASDSFKSIVKHIAIPALQDGRMKIFENVGADLFTAILYLINEKNFGQMPAFYYVRAKRTLMVQFPLLVHEQPVSELREAITKTIDLLPYNRNLVSALCQGSYQFRSKQMAAKPDLTLVILGLDATEDEDTPILVECGFTQNRLTLQEKIHKEVDACPGIVMVIMILVSENPSYHVPQFGSEAWEVLSEEERLGMKAFAARVQAADPAMLVEVLGHVWCSITCIEYFVWVKEGSERILVDPEKAAYGTIFPTIDMDRVAEKIEKGLYRARDSIVAYTKAIDQEANTGTLEDAPIIFSLDWKLVQKSIRAAVNKTAHYRYLDWYDRLDSDNADPDFTPDTEMDS